MIIGMGIRLCSRRRGGGERGEFANAITVEALGYLRYTPSTHG
jgi:hypothetical protein